jgi:membrane protein implicated in regulation of membrane protease activity
MDAHVDLAILVIVAVVALVVSAPLRRGVQDTGEDDEHAELLTEKEAKYREIRDAELDHRTGKLDDADWRVVDRQLRAEAIVILRRIDQLGGEETAPPA